MDVLEIHSEDVHALEKKWLHVPIINVESMLFAKSIDMISRLVTVLGRSLTETQTLNVCFYIYLKSYLKFNQFMVS
jgi:hypothetical protein